MYLKKRLKRKEKMNISPYIGITDFMSFEQVQRMLDVFNEHKPKGSQRLLHVGVMMSFKTLNGLETVWSKVFPQKEDIADIFGSDYVYNCIHYADYEHRSGFSRELSRAIHFGGTGIRALQLDMTWPDPGQIAHGVHTSRKNVEVILQIGRRAFEEAGENPDEIVSKLEDYDGIIHRVLLDKSVGRGIPMNPEELIPYARAIKKRFPKLGIVVAGGLSAENIDRVKPFIEEFPEISIDAQGKLRPSGSALDPIDWNLAEAYLIKALELLR